MGAIIGALLGLGAGYSVSGSAKLAIEAAAAMTLFPMISKLFMEALSPIADAMNTMMKKKFKGREIFIGLDWPILAGRNELWVTVIILVPIELIMAMLLPGNTVLPFAGIINLSFVVAALLLTGANLWRMITLGIITTPIFLYGATYFAPIITRLAKTTGAVKVQSGQQLSWSTFEAPDFRLFFAQAFNGQWWAMIMVVVWVLGFVWLYIDQNKIPVPSKRYITNLGVTDLDETKKDDVKTQQVKSDLNGEITDLDGLNFSNVSKSKPAKIFTINDLDGMDFSNVKK
jgi:PTS system galactitol-specific IIC component